LHRRPIVGGLALVAVYDPRSRLVGIDGPDTDDFRDE
jgi:hypothetical protein